MGKVSRDQIMAKGIKTKDLTNQTKTLLIRGKSPWDPVNQEQTLVTRGRSPEDPAGPAKHVSGMGQSRGKPLKEGEPISVSWPKVKEKRQNASNAQQTGARQYTHGQVLPTPSSYSSKARQIYATVGSETGVGDQYQAIIPQKALIPETFTTYHRGINHRHALVMSFHSCK
ncbi:hypothetical protein QL285_051554 [Trifolium repens]|nr:hypothetical protein QL285_051554 [Trifolium repens]